ncbi:MAG: hypothetical protein GEU97_14920 [Actinophytocola sp.]|nr:hypothetical protein [Actinophytocola sp.]
MRSSRWLVGLVLVMALLPAHSVQATEQETTYGPPYEAGPEDGGTGSYRSANPEDGRVVVARIYPVYNPIQCAPGGAHAKLVVEHTVTSTMSTVVAEFTDAVLDPYTFVTLAIRDQDGEWLASNRVRGPLQGEGEPLEAALFGNSPEPGETVEVHFGLEQASGCPQANFGAATFTRITVS